MSNGNSSFEMKVWCDGACEGNGKPNARAGYGVYFGVRDPRNISRPLEGPLQTNQRGELRAILAALETVFASEDAAEIDLEIITDSSYSINCVTTWYANWESNGWHNAKKEPVKNQDLIRAIHAFLTEHNVKFTHVRGHKKNAADPNSAGNEAADRLAVMGASRLH